MSLTPALLACQTTTPGKKDPAAVQKSILESQKALVRHALDSGKPENAHGQLRGLLVQHPEDPTLHNLMGLTQLALRNPSRAAHHFTTAFKQDQEVATGLNLSSALIENGDLDKATRLLALLLEKAETTRYPYRERLAHNLGYAHLRQKHLTKAEHWFKRALEENPTFFPSHLELARLYEKTRRPAMAMAAYRKAVDFCLACLEPVESLATLYMKAGRPNDARRLLLQYAKQEGTTDRDRSRASQLLRLATAAGIPGASSRAN